MNSEAEFIDALAASPDDGLLREAFADWLEEHGDPRAPWVRSPCRDLHGYMGPRFEDPIPRMIEALRQKEDVTAVRRAAEVIGEPIIPALVELLSHEDAYVRQQAVRCFRRIGKRAAAAVPALVEALKDPDRD